MATKVSLIDAAIFCAVENRPPTLEFADAIGRFLRVKLGHPPVVTVLAAAHRIGKMDLPIIAIVVMAHRRRHPALGHYRVSLTKQRLADQPDAYPSRRCFDSRPQPSATSTDDK